MSKDCLFCNIAEKKIPAEVVYEDENLVVFEDISPQAPIHLLLIPRKHIPTLNDLNKQDQELVGKLIFQAKQLAAERGVSEEGYRLVINCNENAGQEVFHIHVHLLAGRPLNWPPG